MLEPGLAHANDGPFVISLFFLDNVQTNLKLLIIKESDDWTVFIIQQVECLWNMWSVTHAPCDKWTPGIDSTLKH